mmetsp:Transcript_97921/g.210034  ORF Transcript_97921/g.210034 Transcript_97921/m.210034 type:complete len:378 (-) Transcript_97921:269-1402(-)
MGGLGVFLVASRQRCRVRRFRRFVFEDGCASAPLRSTDCCRHVVRSCQKAPPGFPTRTASLLSSLSSKGRIERPLVEEATCRQMLRLLCLVMSTSSRTLGKSSSLSSTPDLSPPAATTAASAASCKSTKRLYTFAPSSRNSSKSSPLDAWAFARSTAKPITFTNAFLTSDKSTSFWKIFSKSSWLSCSTFTRKQAREKATLAGSIDRSNSASFGCTPPAGAASGNCSGNAPWQASLTAPAFSAKAIRTSSIAAVPMAAVITALATAWCKSSPQTPRPTISLMLCATPGCWDKKPPKSTSNFATMLVADGPTPEPPIASAPTARISPTATSRISPTGPAATSLFPPVAARTGQQSEFRVAREPARTLAGKTWRLQDRS